MIIVEDKKQNSLLNLKDLFSFKDTYFFFGWSLRSNYFYLTQVAHCVGCCYYRFSKYVLIVVSVWGNTSARLASCLMMMYVINLFLQPPLPKKKRKKESNKDLSMVVDSVLILCINLVSQMVYWNISTH